MKKNIFKKLTYGIVLLFAIIFTAIMPPRVNAMEGSGVQVPIIMYHSLLNKSTNQWNISPEAFEKDLIYLSENGYQTVFMSDIIAYVYEGAPLPPKPIVLTFDDGYYNNYTKGLPLLEKYDMKIVLSVIGSNTEHWTEHPSDIDERYGHVTWTQIAEMVQSGHVELANHTWDLHHNNNGRNGCCRKKSESGDAYDKLLTEDVEALQVKLEEITGSRPECFTYPFGSRCPESWGVLKKSGFKANLSSTDGMNTLHVDDQECLDYMKRNNRTPKLSLETILKKLETSKNK